MFECVVCEELGDSWTPVTETLPIVEDTSDRHAESADSDCDSDNSDESVTIDDTTSRQHEDAAGRDDHPLQAIASHETGSEIHVGHVDNAWIVNLTDQLVADGLEAHVVVWSVSCDSLIDATGAVRDAGDELSDSYEALAMVGHDGDVSTVDVEHLGEHNTSLGAGTDTLPDHGLVDVFAIDTSSFPEELSQADVVEDRDAIIKFVYGIDQRSPDILTTLESPQNAYGELPIHVFTVPIGDVSVLDTSAAADNSTQDMATSSDRQRER